MSKRTKFFRQLKKDKGTKNYVSHCRLEEVKNKEGVVTHYKQIEKANILGKSMPFEILRDISVRQTPSPGIGQGTYNSVNTLNHQVSHRKNVRPFNNSPTFNKKGKKVRPTIKRIISGKAVKLIKNGDKAEVLFNGKIKQKYINKVIVPRPDGKSPFMKKKIKGIEFIGGNE